MSNKKAMMKTRNMFATERAIVRGREWCVVGYQANPKHPQEALI